MIILYLKGKAVSKEAIDKLWEFGKWYKFAITIVFYGKLPVAKGKLNNKWNDAKPYAEMEFKSYAANV